jgi:hypothetical protein
MQPATHPPAPVHYAVMMIRAHRRFASLAAAAEPARTNLVPPIASTPAAEATRRALPRKPSTERFALGLAW